jgi:hypothetical protein
MRTAPADKLKIGQQLTAALQGQHELEQPNRPGSQERGPESAEREADAQRGRVIPIDRRQLRRWHIRRVRRDIAAEHTPPDTENNMKTTPDHAHKRTSLASLPSILFSQVPIGLKKGLAVAKPGRSSLTVPKRLR